MRAFHIERGPSAARDLPKISVKTKNFGIVAARLAADWLRLKSVFAPKWAAPSSKRVGKSRLCLAKYSRIA